MATKIPSLGQLEIGGPEGLDFLDHPQLFVHLDRTPVVFTIRGLRYFSPRFFHAGVDIRKVLSRSDFEAALAAWDRIEWTLLAEKIERRAHATSTPNAHQLLDAIVKGDLEGAERAVRRLEHSARAGLSVVRDDGSNR